ncbi:MAG TPA: TIGR02679 family protein [Umezawaea sp.]|nr:TIGR02679 family protein [Umezawaea sp.]
MNDRLVRLLGGDELTWLVDRVRRRLERAEPLEGVVTLSNATPAQRQAVQRLLGRAPRPGANVSVSLSGVDEVLRRSGACPGGLGAAVIALTGPVHLTVDPELAWTAAFAPLVDDRLVDWYSTLRASGLVKRLAGTPEAAVPLLTDLAAVIHALPSRGEPIGRFAARVTGDAHALDDDRPLATLALGAARALTGLPAGTDAAWRREVWASVGLLRDELSTTVLALGLSGDPTLDAWREVGQPVSLTLRQLVRNPPRLDVRLVAVCENPVVLASAADHLGPACPPLVCTSGQPGTAVMHLLRLLVASGAALHYHGDFDWGGLRIGNVLHERIPFTPWRFDTAAYLAAGDLGRPLAGPPVPARWDPDLAGTMHRVGRRVEEELVLDTLLDDLATFS